MSAWRNEWRVTPWWLRLLGKKKYMRDKFAPAMIGGGWDGWDFSDTRFGGSNE